MSNLQAYQHQSPFDLAIQEYGSIEGIFDLLAANPGLEFDSDIASGTVLKLEGEIVNQAVVDYYENNNIKPATGNIEGLIEFTKDDGGMITKAYNYNLAGGSNTFDGVRLFNLYKDVSIQINYTAINTGVKVYIETSLDGVNFSPIPDADYTLDNTRPSHTFLLLGLTVAYIRLRVDNGAAGTIDKMIIET